MAAQYGAGEQGARLHNSARQHAGGTVPAASGQFCGVETGAGDWREKGRCVWLPTSAGFAELWRWRARQISTVICTVASLIETGQVKLDAKWISPDAQPLIEAACLKQGVERLRDIKEAVPPYVSFDDIRLVVAHLRAENRLPAKTA